MKEPMVHMTENEHMAKNFICAWICLVRGVRGFAWHVLHGLFPYEFTSHDYWDHLEGQPK